MKGSGGWMNPARFRPAYLELHDAGELEERAARAYDVLRSCTVCPRRCRINRSEDSKGFCRTGLLPAISSYGPHFGEEPPLVGRGGSGTIFVTHCSMACTYCQNSTISRCGEGSMTSPEHLAGIMLLLQRQGCANINIVTPTHIVPQLIRSIAIAADQGLALPLVHNSGGYDSAETLRILDGIVDIYMPDAKYGSDEAAALLSDAPGYTGVMKDALREMHRQVGDLILTEGIARRGLLVRHLVLPGNLAGSDLVLPWIAREISRETYVNIMDQYHWPFPLHLPERLAGNPRYDVLRRRITAREYEAAVRWAREAGLHRGFPC